MATSNLPDVKSVLASALWELDSATRDCGSQSVSYEGRGVVKGVCGATCCFFLGWKPLVLSAFVRILVLVWARALCGRPGLSGLCGLGRRPVVGDCHCRQIRSGRVRTCRPDGSRPSMRDKAVGGARRGQSMVSRFPREKLIGSSHRFSHACRFGFQPSLCLLG